VTEERPVDQVLDLLIYAPIGFALEAKELLPQLADRGRGQVALMRLAGRMAAQQAPDGDVADTVRQGVSAVLDGLSTLLGTDEASSSAAAATAGAPIDGYDDLTAREIVALLAGRSDGELTAIRAYELANRARSTVINRVEQLLG
jgi:hypothetical protein